VTTGQLIVIAAIVLLASFTQVIAGFGFGLMSVPLMALAIPVTDAIVVSTLVGTCVSGWQSIHQRKLADRPLVRRLVVAAYVGMPLGIWVFVAVDLRVLKVLLGVAVIAAVVVLATGLNWQHAGPRLDYVAGFVSGVLNTSVSTNGPPLVFAMQARQLSAEVFRASISAVFALSSIGGLALFIAAGKVTQRGIGAAAIALPAMLLGQVLGYPARKHVHGERFRRLVLVLLTGAAISTIVSGLA
jgi:uncharacterized protein